jgi:hypothetical protein
MTQRTESTYYVSRTPKLLRSFDRFSKRLRRSLAERHGEAFAREAVAATRVEFERIIPELPYVGGRKNIFSPIIVINGWLIAFYRAMASRGKTAEEVIRICARVTDGLFKPFPPFVLRLAGRLALSGIVKKRLEKHAVRSQERRYPADWVFFTARGDGAGEAVLEFTECAVNKLYEAQGVEELKPYCNFVDVTYSRYMGMGLDARETLGLGCDRCRLRYKRGRETVIPDSLRGILPDT